MDTVLKSHYLFKIMFRHQKPYEIAKMASILDEVDMKYLGFNSFHAEDI